jgi:hypothetical protein
VVGGLEVIPFGVLIFVSFTLVIANAWAVVDAKLAVESASREAGRAYVEAHDPATAPGDARDAAEQAMAAAGRDPGRLGLSVSGGPYVRCAVVEHTATYLVPRAHRAVPGFVRQRHHRPWCPSQRRRPVRLGQRQGERLWLLNAPPAASRGAC